MVSSAIWECKTNNSISALLRWDRIVIYSWKVSKRYRDAKCSKDQVLRSSLRPQPPDHVLARTILHSGNHRKIAYWGTRSSLGNVSRLKGTFMWVANPARDSISPCGSRFLHYWLKLPCLPCRDPSAHRRVIIEVITSEGLQHFISHGSQDQNRHLKLHSRKRIQGQNLNFYDAILPWPSNAW